MRRVSLPVLLLLAWLSACRVPPKVRELIDKEVALRQVVQVEPAAHPAALTLLPGDYVLSGRGIQVVIGGMGRAPTERGEVLSAAPHPTSGQQPAASLRASLHVAGLSRAVAVQRVFEVKGRATPTLRIEGIVRVAKQPIAVARELSVARVPGTLSLSVRVASARPQHAVRVGGTVQWGGAPPFLPGLGAVTDQSAHRSEWVAAEGSHSAAALALASGQLRVRATYEQHQGQPLPVHTEWMEAQAFDLEPERPVYRKVALSVGPPSLGALVRKLYHFRGRPLPEAWVHLPFQPEGTQVELRDQRGQLLLVARPDAQGSAVLPLHAREQPTDQRIATASAYGHAPSDPHVIQDGERAFSLRIPEGGQIRVRVRSAQDGRPLAARARILPRDVASPLSLGPDHRAQGAGDTVITLRGSTSIPVPPGRYTVLVSHGPEWSVHEADVAVTTRYSPLISAELVHEVQPGPWVACDLHLHSAMSSDSQVTLSDRLSALAAEGVQFAVPTDHNHVTDYAPTARELALSDFATVTGVEITTWDPAFGHFNAYPFPLDNSKPAGGAPVYSNTSPRALFAAVHALDPDMVVQINHPRLEGGIGYFDVMQLDAETGAAGPRYSGDFDAIEVFNGFDLARPERVDQVFRDWLRLLARGQHVVATGSSDSHQVRYQLAGYPRTYANVAAGELRDPRAIVRAIKRGAAFVTSGPFLEVSVSGAGPGEQVVLQDGVAQVAIRVRAPAWMPLDELRIYLGKTLVHRAQVPSTQRVERFSEVVPVRLSTDTFVVVRVESESSMERFFGRAGVFPLAFSNPIFIDADGDGHTPWSRQK